MTENSPEEPADVPDEDEWEEGVSPYDDDDDTTIQDDDSPAPDDEEG